MEDLSEVFNDTERLYTSDEELIHSVELTQKAQKLYFASDEINLSLSDLKRFEKTKIIVSKKKSFEAAMQHCRQGEKVTVLNFANSLTPGGSVLFGARAQEEDLCRVSTLYAALSDDYMEENFYVRHCKDMDNFLGTDDIIYSPNVKVFKSDINFELLDRKDWFDVDVITCAAPDLSDISGNLSPSKIANLLNRRWRRILTVAAENGCSDLVLGAFGCGVFMNPCEVVAISAKNALEEFDGVFKTVEFAVFCPNELTNYTIFNAILSDEANQI